MTRVNNGSAKKGLLPATPVGLGLLLVLAAGGPADSRTICKVADPTGSPLNVRDQPNGRVINALRNGREVFIRDASYDEEGKPWVLVDGVYQGRYRTWGWVVREFLACYRE